MSVADGDISWAMLRSIVRRWAGTDTDVDTVARLEGGHVNTTLLLTLADGARAVLKISPHRVNREFACEAHQLDLLRGLGVPTPAVYECSLGSLEHPFSYLLMEFVEGVDLAKAKAAATPDEFDAIQSELADLLLRVHATTGPAYRRVLDGATDAPAHDAWPGFYRTVYDGIWHAVEKASVLPVKCRKTVARVHERLARLIAHDDRPRLVHGDVWSTNILVKPTPVGWRVTALLDPMCKYAHAEAELAYLELFHTSTPAFLRAYQRDARLPTDYHRVRKHVYHLYELLNHVHLFGQEYVKPTIAAAERLAPLV